MTMRTTARLFSVALLSLSLITGCASTGDTDSALAEQAIAEAKLAEGDEEGAIALANKAKAQAEDAVAQAEEENKKFLNANSDAAAMAASSASSGAAAGGVSSYSVVRGDNLWSISGKDDVYADPYQWPLIYKTNRNKIKDADLIFPGQVLDIDQNASASEIDAAINHAKTRGAWSVGDTEQSDRDYLAK